MELDIITIRLGPEDARHLMAAEGYLSLGMYEEADAELEQITPRFALKDLSRTGPAFTRTHNNGTA